MPGTAHHYIDRDSGTVQREQLLADPLVRWLYAESRESPAWFMKAIVSPRLTQVLAAAAFDLPVAPGRWRTHRLAGALGIDLDECADPPESIDTPRKLFERRIRYWDRRPMNGNPAAIVSPADARVLVGSLAETSQLFVKDKWFSAAELLGTDHPHWQDALARGDFAIFRLTPDKYHYNHAPVDGVVRHVYEIPGGCHSCNPHAVVIASTYAKNARTVTLIDTDVPGGTGIGRVAMIEIVALMIGVVEQCYSDDRYAATRPVTPGLVLRKGQPKSRFRPGSSTVVLLFERDRVIPCDDLVANQSRPGVESRFSQGLGRRLVETDVRVRSTIAHARREAT
jgi:phosphatidylserine decarboxylase